MAEVSIVVRVHGNKVSGKQGNLVVKAELLHFGPAGVGRNGVTPPRSSSAGNPPPPSRNSFGGCCIVTRHRRRSMGRSRGPGFRRSTTMTSERTYSSSPLRVHNRLSWPALSSPRGAGGGRAWLKCTASIEEGVERVNRQVLSAVLVRSFTEHCTFAEKRCSVRNSALVLPQSRDWMLAKERS